ncbi:MAG: hypothetical protein RR241_06725, partial [Raoultibacter sp.]
LNSTILMHFLVLTRTTISGAGWVSSISPMKCYEQAWKDWLTCDNEYAQGDRAAMESGGFALMNLIQIKLTVL